MELKLQGRPVEKFRSLYTEIGKTPVIFLSAFLVAFGVGMVILGIVFHIREVFRATASQVGYFTAAWSFSYIMGCIFMRPVFNRIPPRYLMMYSTFLMSIFVISVLLVKDFWLAYIFYGLYGFAESLFWPSTMGWLSKGMEGPKLGKIMSMYNFSWSMGMILSPLIAGLLSKIESSLPIFIGGGIYFLTCLVVIAANLTLPKIKRELWADSSDREGEAKTDNSTFLRYPSWFGLFTTYAVIGMIISIFPVYSSEGLFFGKGMIGFLLQIRMLCATVGFVILGRTSIWHFNSAQILVGQLIQGFTVFLMIFARSPIANAVLIALIGFCISLSYFNSLFHGVSGSTQRAGRMATHEAILSAGLIFGSSIGGVLYQRFSMTAVYSFCATLVIWGLLIQGVFVLHYVFKKE